MKEIVSMEEIITHELTELWCAWIIQTFSSKRVAAVFFGEESSNFRKFFTKKRKLTANIILKSEYLGFKIDWKAI